MDVQKMSRSIAEYELFPRAVRLGVKTAFTLRGLGVETCMKSGEEYIIRVIPHEENISAITMEISDFNRYEGLNLTVSADNALHFSCMFPREQIYTLKLLRVLEYGGQKDLVDLRVYAAADDLWERTPMRGNTHCHACPSVDGSEDPALAAAMYRKAGFDYLAITDHHLIDGSLMAIAALQNIPHSIALYPGEEVHVPNAYIHAVNVGADFGGIGLNTYYNQHKEKCDAEAAEIRKTLTDLPFGVEPQDLAWRIWISRKIHEKGGLAIAAHPFWTYQAHNTRNATLRYLTEHKLFDAMEVLGGQEPGSMEANLQIAFWNDMRADGLYMPIVGCDDAHRRHFDWREWENCFNMAYTLIFAKEPSFDGFKEAIENRFSAAVDRYDGATPHVVGTYRLTKYIVFLLEQYFPIHDELCFSEGQLIWDAYLGDEDAHEALPLACSRVRKFECKFFGRPSPTEKA